MFIIFSEHVYTLFINPSVLRRYLLGTRNCISPCKKLASTSLFIRIGSAFCKINNGNDINTITTTTKSDHGLCGSNKLLYKRCVLSRKKAIFDPRSSEIWERPTRNSNFRNTFRGPLHMPKMVKIGLRAWAGPIPRFSGDRPVLRLFLFFLYSLHSVPVRPLDQLRRLMAQNARFRPRKCLLGVSMTKNNVWG